MDPGLYFTSIDSAYHFYVHRLSLLIWAGGGGMRQRHTLLDVKHKGERGNYIKKLIWKTHGRIPSCRG